MSVGARMFKDSLLMGTFLFPLNISHVNMISSFTTGSLGSSDPWAVLHLKDVESYGASLPLTTIDIVDPKIPLIFVDIGQQLHPYMKCDKHTLTIQVVDSLCSHNFLYTEFPLDKAILDVMTSIVEPKDEVTHQSSCPNSKPMTVIMMRIDPKLGAFVGESGRPPILGPFQNLPTNSLLPFASKIHI